MNQIVQRLCGSKVAKVGCHEQSENGATVKVCVCDKELCNSATRRESNMFLQSMTAFTVFKVAYKIYN